MPQQRLPFGQWSQRRESSISVDVSEFSSQQLNDLDQSQTPKCQSSRPRTASTTSSTKPRTSWVFSHMPDEEMETRYYNPRTGKEEWRCKHCDRAYACSGGTAAPAKHLMDPPPDGHGLPKGALRTAKMTMIRTILEQARAAAEENPRKRRRLNGQSGETIRKWIMRHCDLWTSPNSLAILGVVGHYVTEDGQLEHHILALKDIDSEHDGSHLAAAILEVVDEWGFASKLGYFVMDNAGSNDTMMRSLSLGLLRRYDIRYDPKVHRLRCQGHIINLAAKAFLFVTDNEKLERDDPGLYNVTLKHIEAWRKKGPLGKLHNFVVYIQRNVQRSQKFLAISHNRKLARDNDTRWSSWYAMLRAALNLRDAIDGYFNKWMEADCAGDELSSEDWAILEKIKSFLEKLKMTTKALESSFATLDNVLLAMDFVLAQFEAGKEANVDDPVMAPMYNSGWAKMDKYYRLTDESPAYVAAIVLHPSHKWHYIQENWKKEWVESSKELLETLWNEYKPVESPLPLCEVPSATTNEFLNWRNKHLQPSLITDEYERYCKSERVYGFTSALAWWLEETQQKNYPSLSKMAVDILSIPAMSAEPDRLFSGAKITITDRRNRLGSDVIEALECLKSCNACVNFGSELVSDGEDKRAGDKEEQERHGERADSAPEQGLLTVQVRLLTNNNTINPFLFHHLRILRRYYNGYREVMDPKCSGSNDQEIVDLLRSDAEMGEDAYEEEDGEDSPYFNTTRHADIRA
ncbi:ribonuclease H [Fusarium mundagurra]|uniref:Ribonuclease H n=1 Tax=Fusarium mundagurra TaxID=1567541 RepID=A0A8H6D6H2_9HYPO|nr:ribonuclease H [Fusarium mundagurra]